MKNCSAFISAFILLSISCSVLAEGTPSAGKDKLASLKGKANDCAICHKDDGNSITDAYPKLAGQHSSYLYKQLKDFKNGSRKGLMSGMIAGLSDTDFKNLAAYYASKTVKTGNAKNDTLVMVGRKLYEGGNPNTKVPACSGCHGPAGKGNSPAKFPALGGQHAKYTAAQLIDFRKAARGWVKNEVAKKAQGEANARPGRNNDKNRMMQHVALSLSDAEIEAVSSYIEGLRARAKLVTN